MPTLNFNAAGVVLSPNFTWLDEFAWSAVVQSTEYTVTGALIVDSATKLAGRPVTLGDAEGRAWLTRADVQTLQQWADTAGAVMTLQLGAAAHSVMFDHARGPLSVRPLVDYADPHPGDYYIAEIRLIKV